MTKKFVVCLATLLFLAASGVWSCSSSEPSGEEATAEAASAPEPVVEPAPPEPAPVQEEEAPMPAETPMATSEPSAAQLWEETAWVAGKEGKLVLGLDGGEYDPYSVSAVQEVQQALKTRGLYAGSISGVLDQATMQAIGEFQKNNSLQACGVPTPHTREMLLQR
jgi:hypothetical protein